MTILNIEIPDEAMERLESLAREHKTSVEKLVLAILMDLVRDKVGTTPDDLSLSESDDEQ
jgi:hypothetical protein